MKTQSFIGFFQIATGKVYSPYLNETRTEADFCEAVRKVVETDSEKTDVKLISEVCGLKEGLGKKGKTGILKSKQSREEFNSQAKYTLVI